METYYEIKRKRKMYLFERRMDVAEGLHRLYFDAKGKVRFLYDFTGRLEGSVDEHNAAVLAAERSVVEFVGRVERDAVYMKKKMAGAFRRAGECLRRALVRYKAIHLSNDASLRIRRAEKEMGVLQEVFEEELPGIEEEVAGLLRRI